jgi:hypothetical protein
MKRAGARTSKSMAEFGRAIGADKAGRMADRRRSVPATGGYPPRFDEPGLAGEHVILQYGAEGNVEIHFKAEGNGRACGDCQLCCKLVPVPVIQKPAGKRCQHAKHGKGCTIYENRPFDCRSWSCRWLADKPNTEMLNRPDRSHFVIDITPDTIKQKFENGEERTIGVIQIWADPAFPEVHHGAEMRAYMAHMAEAYGYPSLVRWNSRDAVCIFPPSICADREWHEIAGNVTAHNEWERMLVDNWEAVTEP